MSRTFRLPEEMVEVLEALASENRLSLNQLVIQCLRYSLEHLDPAEETDPKER
ncbi:Arc family DNA-binding protein [Cloacibacillus evryensis]|uniref:Arc family DNA-binding protein n=1 Tax=Cloacibacillus evryensis TaxID=508460 RepID=UPI003AB734CE